MYVFQVANKMQMTLSEVQYTALMRRSLLSDFHTVPQFTLKSGSVCAQQRQCSRFSDQDMAGRFGVRSPREEVFDSSPKCPDRFWGQHSLVYNGQRDPLRRAKRSGRDVEHSRLCSDERVELYIQISYTFTFYFYL
jgi:hypothetical protein